MNVLSIYLSHNASATLIQDGEITEVLEFERFFNVKNQGCLDSISLENPLRGIKGILDYFKSKYQVYHYDVLLTNIWSTISLRRFHFASDNAILSFFNAKKLELVDHQYAHMATAFYQTDLESSRGISYDGAGNDGNFNIYDCSRTEGIKLIGKVEGYKLGWKYSYFGEKTKSIRKEPDFWQQGGLVYPGKLMGLASYGNVREDWLPHFNNFNNAGFNVEFPEYQTLTKNCNIPDQYDGQIEYDVAATAQRSFEETFDRLARPYFQNEDKLLLSGGCALNITNNQRIAKERKIYVPPNPGDGGLTLGFALDYLKPKQKYNATFMGPEVWDKHNLMEYVQKYNGREVSHMDLAEEVLKGKIIGIVRGRAELGPRALGNRSIICHAAQPGMKDILNAKVKNREYYRPFAPVCRKDEMGRFFEMTSSPHEHMSLCPTVREEYREALASITHIDNTARLQVTDEHDSPTFYHILANIAEMNPYPVLLNTSFNIAGKPILNTYRDAIWMLENTEMDGLILEDYYIKK